MRRFDTVVRSCAIGLLLVHAATTSAQPYPHKPVRIVTVAIGGGSDVVSRLSAPEISAALGQPVIIENRDRLANAEVVAKALPDGYTLLVNANNFLYGPLLQKMSFDPVRDFAPISLLVRSPSVLVVNPSLPARSVKELIAMAKTKPGALNYVSGGAGGTSHLTAELFKAMAGVQIMRIPYKGTGLGINALLGGEEVQMSFETSAGVTPYVKSGRLRALAVTSSQASALVPGVAPLADSVPGFEALSLSVMLAPAGTPTPIINRLHQEIVRVFTRADMKERLFNVGVEAVASSPQELAGTMKSEIAKIGKVIKDANIRVE